MTRTYTGSLAEQAYERILEKILRGDLPPGTPLSRRSLAQEFGMSVLPVSEALQRLESDGLAESRPRVGTRVRIPTPRDVRGHYSVREALESQSARLFSEKASAQERKELLAMARQLDQMNARVATGNPDPEFLWTLHRRHLRFHMRIAECTGCEPLCQAIEKNQILIFNWFYDVAFERRVLPPKWHQQLADGLNQQDPGTADATMRRHVRYGMEEALRKLETSFTEGAWRSRRALRQAREA